MFIIGIWGLLNLFLAIVAVFKVRKNPKQCEFIWSWAFPAGAFVWEDMLIFGFLHFIVASISFVTANPSVWIIGFIVFWMVRSAGETLYFFLQQFIEPKHHPHYIHNHFKVLRSVLGDISDQKAFIILQITMQSILVLSMLSLIFYLNYRL